MGTIFPVQVVLYHVVDFTTILCNNIFFCFRDSPKNEEIRPVFGGKHGLAEIFCARPERCRMLICPVVFPPKSHKMTLLSTSSPCGLFVLCVGWLGLGLHKPRSSVGHTGEVIISPPFVSSPRSLPLSRSQALCLSTLQFWPLCRPALRVLRSVAPVVLSFPQRLGARQLRL